MTGCTGLQHLRQLSWFGSSPSPHVFGVGVLLCCWTRWSPPPRACCGRRPSAGRLETWPCPVAAVARAGGAVGRTSGAPLAGGERGCHRRVRAARPEAARPEVQLGTDGAPRPRVPGCRRRLRTFNRRRDWKRRPCGPGRLRAGRWAGDQGVARRGQRQRAGGSGLRAAWRLGPRPPGAAGVRCGEQTFRRSSRLRGRLSVQRGRPTCGLRAGRARR
jgi:hypothetical protein